VAVPTKIKLKDFFKAVQLIAVEKGITANPYKGSRGSAVCFRFFKKNEETPFYLFCYDEDLHSRVIYSDDLKKACKGLGINKKEFEGFVKKMR